MKQELAIMKARHAIELEDLRKQADYLETQKMRAVGVQKDEENELQKLKDTNIKVKKQLEEVDQRIILKKRFVMHQVKKNEANEIVI